jgi:hypothetical protein
MARVRSIHSLKSAVLTSCVPTPRPRYDGQGAAGGGQAAGASGVVPGGGAGTPSLGGGVSVPPAPAPTPQPTPTTAPSVGSPGQGQAAGGVQGGQPPQPGQALPGQQQPQPGQPANPLAAFQSLPPQALALVQQWQQAAQWAERNRHFATLGYQAWQQAQGRGGQPQPGQPAPAPQPQAPANPFGVPKFDLRNLSLIQRGEDGRYQVDPYAPPGLLQEAQAYQEKLAQATHGFFTEPEKYLEPIVRRIAEAVAQQTHQQQFGQVQQQQFAQQTLRENADWLFEKDAAGNVVQEFDVRTGQPKQKLSGWGLQYAQEVQRLAQSGVNDGRQQHELAVRHVQNLAYQMMFRQQQAAAQGQQQNQQFLAAGQAGQLPVPGQGPGGQSPPAPVHPNAAPQAGGRQSLRQMLNAAYDANGITDSNIHAHVMNGVGGQG